MNRRLLVLFSFLLMPFLGNATHLLGGEITWRCTANNTGYIFTMKLYKDCGTGTAGLGATQSISGPNGSISVTRTSTVDISPTCLGGGSISCGNVASGEGAVETHTYVSGTVFLSGSPPAGGWLFTWSSCCRPGTVQNGPSNAGYMLRAIMYPYTPQGATAPLNTSTCFDNSPVFIETGSLTQCEGSSFTYNHLAADKDLDSLFVKWADPWTGLNTPVSWGSGYSSTSPFPNTSTNSANGPVTLDGASGAVTMDVQVADAGSYASCFAIESWRCGQLGNKPGWLKIAEVFRDVAIVFKKNCAANNEPFAELDTALFPMFTRVDNVYRTRVYPSDSVIFEFTASDFDFLPSGSPQTIYFSAAGLQVADPLGGTSGCLGATPCASLNPISPQSGYSNPLNNNIEFFWVPNCNHLNFGNTGCGGLNTFYFSLRMEDDACPAPEIALSTIIIEVVAGDPTPVELKCVFYDHSSGQVRLGWQEPELDSGIVDFNYYRIYGATSKAGPYTVVDSIPLNRDSIVTYIDTTPGYQYFYMEQSTGACDFISGPSDTLSLMQMTLVALPPVSSERANLSWTQMISPLPNSSRGVYEIWSEAPAGSGNWVQVGETSGLTYEDTVTVCGSDVNYQIRITDTVTGCQSGSTVDLAFFSDKTNNDILQFDSVTVNMNGNAQFSWPASNYGDVTDYYILFNDPKSGWIFIDTVPVGTTMPYEWVDSEADTRAEEFKVVSVDSCGNQASEQLVTSNQTIYLRNALNKCEGFSRLSWTPYKRFVGGVAGYRLWVEATDGNGNSSAAALLYGGTSDDSTFTHLALQNGYQYCYWVQAYDTSGAITSSSNRICIQADVPKKSRLLYLAQVTNNFTRNSIDLVAYVDGEADVLEFDIQRALDRYGPYESIGTVSKPTQVPYVVRYRDYGVRPGALHYYYRLIATNVCGGIDTVSNNARNVLLEVNAQANLNNKLTWNSYTKFDGNVDKYEIYRAFDGTEDLSQFEYIGETIGNDTIYFDNVRSFADEEKGKFCYYVKAVEGNNPLGLVADDGSAYSSITNRVCVNQKARVFLATAFRPESDISDNRKFGPTMRFEDVKEYDFYILDRWGTAVFRTNDPEEKWDGNYKGDIAPQGVYVYYLKYSTLEDVPREEKGSFTLIR